jgi:A/G-specific adenine glycosylase
MEKHGGEFPQTFEEVLALPGIGRYTAGALLSIALDQKVPIVDANVARVLARVLCLEGDVKNSENQARLWSEAGQLVEAASTPSQFNPAMMELGALICVPKTPRCEVCPVKEFCCAFRTQRQNELPHATPKRKEIEMHDVCAFVLREDKVLLRRRSDEVGDKNWWRGLWELPRTTLQSGESTHDALRRLFEKEIGAQIEIGEKIKSVSHGVTHHRIALDCLQVELQKYCPRDDWRFFAWEQTGELALPSMMRRLLQWLQSNAASNKQLRLL